MWFPWWKRQVLPCKFNEKTIDIVMSEIKVVHFAEKKTFILRFPSQKAITVRDMKLLIGKLYSIPYFLQRLVYPCHEIKDEVFIRDLNLTLSSNPIYLTLRSDESVTMVRFTIMTVCGSRFSVKLPLSANLNDMLDEIANQAQCKRRDFSVWMNNKELISKTMEITNESIIKVFNIPEQQPEKATIFEVFLAVRLKTEPHPTKSVILRVFQRLLKPRKSLGRDNH